MVGRFVVKASGGERSFRLKAAGNNELIFTGNATRRALGRREMHSLVATLDAGIAALKANAPAATLGDQARPRH
jgi:uncharacterized protein YegP (UPF0339 family)